MSDPRMVQWIKGLGAVMVDHPDEFEVISAVFGQASSELTLRTILPEKVLPGGDEA